MHTSEKIVVIGASGQIGTELTENLQEIYGHGNIIACDIKNIHPNAIFENLDILDTKRLTEIIQKYSPTQVYLLAALLSATAEKQPLLGWQLNMTGLLNVLEAAKEHKFKIFWPSSIAVFGPTTPKQNVPQSTITEPTTVYGISKLSGERWCEYYHSKYGIDVRSVRYPGLIGYKALPGGGTTDYAVEIFYKALQESKYECFLDQNSTLPMMYMPDALRGTVKLMQAASEQITIRSSYNIAAMSFSPKEIAEEIKKNIPEFNCTYNPDSRQLIADSWPASIDDSVAKKHWNWSPQFDLKNMVQNMIKNIRLKI